jgi:hypothetical protein
LLTYVKVIKTNEDPLSKTTEDSDADRTLKIKGFSEQGEVLFTYGHKS